LSRPEPLHDPEETPPAALRVISRLYDAVVNEADYEPIFFAMDEFIETELVDPPPARKAVSWAALFGRHFQQVGHVFDMLTRQAVETPLSFVEGQTSAAAVLDGTGRILTANAEFRTFFGAVSGLGAICASGEDKARFAAVAAANRPDTRTLVSVTTGEGLRNAALMVGHLPDVKGYCETAPLLSAVLVQPRWTQALADILRQAYRLTDAELDTLRAFVECGTAQGIAEIRGRSIRTVRTQLSRIFMQMGISGQTELALFLAALAQMPPNSEQNAVRDAAPGSYADDAITRHVVTGQSGPIEVLDYGDPDGAPVLLTQSTHPPQWTKPLREACADAGLRVLAPLKPGSGRTVALGADAGPDAMATLYRDVLNAFGVARAVVAGQASGGLYALEFARRYPDRCHAVGLIDTGTPFGGTADLLKLPGAIRRTMVPARLFPDMLFLPHRLVAANFARSKMGEATVIDYFFEGSPEDQNLTRTDAHYYEATRAIISHSFEDTDRLVHDVARWASDWSALLTEVVTAHRLIFVHGQRNRMFRPDAIREFADGRAQCDLVTIPECGQLAAFQRPQLVAEALLDLASAN